jgi:hypothetical protein
VNVAPKFPVPPQLADDLPVYDAPVVDVKEQFEIGAAHLFDQFDAKIRVVSKVAGMPFHRVA